jgi:NitT/TauT family transport system ATP-binding protein
MALKAIAGGAKSVDISAERLAVNFGRAHHALSGVNLDISEGEFVALIGASGCGKTTLLNVIAGLVPVASGKVTIRNSPPAAGRSDICYILARDALLPWRTVQGNVEYGLELSGVGRDERARRAQAYVEKVGLESYRDFYPSKLSQGMRQRVSLAHALG